MNRLFLFLIACSYMPTSFAYIGGVRPSPDISSTIKVDSCTAVKVAEHFVLTAAHCADLYLARPKKTIDLLDSNGRMEDGHFVSTTFSNIFLSPSYQATSTSNSGDFALIEVDDASLFTPAKISIRPIQKEDILLVGGCGEEGPGYPNYGFLTVAKKNIVFINELNVVVGIQDADGVHLSMADHGDSGGPVYRPNRSGSLEVVGINGARTVSANLIQVDPKTGQILQYDQKQPPYLWISRFSDKDLIWLQSMLPADSFIND